MNRQNRLFSKLPYVLAPALYLAPIATIGAPGTLSQKPLFATTSAEPNVLFVLDDSGSMDWGIMVDAGTYIPKRNGTGESWDDEYVYTFHVSDNEYAGSGTYRTAPNVEVINQTEMPGLWRIRNGTFNKIYYNPTVNYTPWAGVDKNGNAYTDADPTAALKNPYDPSAGTVNLTVIHTYTARRPNYPGDFDGTTTVTASFMPMRYWAWKDDTPANSKVDYTDTHKLIEIKSGTATCASGLSASQTEQTTGSGCMLRSLAAEKQNFANWWQYHRRREYAMKHAMSHIIAPIAGVRMGMFTIQHNQTGDRREIASMNADPATGNKRALLDALFKVHSNNGTPLRNALNNAGKYYQCSGTNVFGNTNCPVEKTFTAPATEAPGVCQQNFTVLMTDGYYNGSSVTSTNHDNDGSTYTGFNYDRNITQSFKFDGKPYQDGYTQTLADIAMYYYERDLHSTLNNKVPMRCGIDENPGQHMVTYTVAFGVLGSVDPATVPAHPMRGYPNNCTDNTGSAPTFAWPSTAGNSGKIDDMLHAAYNGRGEFYSAQNSIALANDLLAALNSIISRTGSASSVSFNSSKLDINTKLFIGLFDSTKWSGDLEAYTINPLNGDISNTPVWSAAGVLDGRNLGSAPRKILTYNGTDGVPFTWTGGITTAMKNDLRTNDNGDLQTNAHGMARLAYLRGERSCETGNGGTSCSYNDGVNTFSSKIFRVRDSRLGDIIHSDPIFVGPPSSPYPDTAPFPTTSGSLYSEFVTAQKTRLGVVYVGANDGMLHAFREDNGSELFAYVPSFVTSTSGPAGLHYLTSQAYTHRYYVDLKPFSSDAFIKTSTTGSSAWRTVLIGGTRAGGRGIFALDVTNPTGITEAGAASAVLWEFSNSDDADMGHSFSIPTVALMNNGKWAVIFGNGYNDTGSGKAQLFILFMDTNGALTGSWTSGTDYVKIDTGVGTTADRNGLSTPRLLDVDGNRTVDRIYAGDLKGNLWVFDVSDSSASNWDVAFKNGTTPKPLFTAPAGQAITTIPSFTKHPTEADSGSNQPNRLIFFGTGQYVTDADKYTTSTQAFYGVWDKGSIKTAGGGTSYDIGDLVEQTLLTGTGPDVRVPTDNPVNYSNKNGWYMNLPDSGERVITRSIIRGGIVFFSTTIPSANACDFGGTGWQMSLKAENGGRPAEAVFDINGDNKVDNQDLVAISGTNYAAGGTKFKTGMPGAPNILGDYRYTPTTGNTNTGAGGTGKNAVEKDRVQTLTGGTTGRLSWEELMWQ